MALNIAILKETAKYENRVAATPETVKKLKDMGCNVMVEKGAGARADIADVLYKDAGAMLKARAEALKNANIVLSVQTPDVTLSEGTLLIGMHDPHNNADLITKSAKTKIDLIAMEFMPRITRAQSMDVLSSQSNLAGYKSVLDACEHFSRALPMMMTAAGTIPPAKVFVMGAGVAGLQAIATARRLGAQVTATDVRPAAKEQVESLGASFIAVENNEFKEAETAGGYAKEMSTDYKKQQAALVESHIAKQDIVITTALIPGRPAPELISEKMVKSMAQGSVIVDLAAPAGGNCALSEPGKIAEKHGVTIIAHTNTPSRLAKDASNLYARNLLAFLKLIINEENGELAIDEKDDIIQGVRLTHNGKIVHPAFAEKKKAVAKKTSAKKPAAKKPTVKKKAADKPKTYKPKKKEA